MSPWRRVLGAALPTKALVALPVESSFKRAWVPCIGRAKRTFERANERAARTCVGNTWNGKTYSDDLVLPVPFCAVHVRK